jgi:hypothetical protein
MLIAYSRVRTVLKHNANQITADRVLIFNSGENAIDAERCVVSGLGRVDRRLRWQSRRRFAFESGNDEGSGVFS